MCDTVTAHFIYIMYNYISSCFDSSIREPENCRDSHDEYYDLETEEFDDNNGKNENSGNKGTKDDKVIVTETQIKTSFSDVKGQDWAIRNLEEYVEFFLHRNNLHIICT